MSFLDGLPLFHYSVIHIDPPWAYEMRTPKGYGKSPQAHYDCMDMDALRALPIGQLGRPDSVMVMWGLFSMMPRAVDLLAHYGYRYVTGGAWAKQSSTGQKWAFGSGYVFRAAAEYYIVGKMGNPVEKSKSVRNLIVAPVREHSRKPEQIYSDIEALWDGPYLDIFGRCQRPGWTVVGNEAEKFEAGA